MSSVQRVVVVLTFAVLTIIVHDVLSPVSRSVSATTALVLIGQYQSHVSPYLRGRVFCRFTPTCSVYGRESIRKYGAVRGGARAVWRVMRCGPWTRAGTFDPP